MRRLRILLDHMYTRRRLSAYLDGELDGDARRRVERHTRECGDCDKTLGALSDIGAALRHLGRVQRSPSPTGRLGQARERSQGSG
jgi:anti-sigma factor RsiW